MLCVTAKWMKMEMCVVCDRQVDEDGDVCCV